MGSEENFAEALAGEEARLGAVELYFFELLAALAFKFGLGERGFARQLVNQLQERLGEFRKTPKAHGAIVRAGIGGKVGTEEGEGLLWLGGLTVIGFGGDDRGGFLLPGRG